MLFEQLFLRQLIVQQKI